MVKVIGFDLSVTRTGVHGDGFATHSTVKGRGVTRLVALRKWMNDVLDEVGSVSLAGVEGYSYASRFSMATVAEWGGVARTVLADRGINLLVVPPSSAKKFATGSGNASKHKMIEAVYKRANGLYVGTVEDEADAFWVYAFARHWVKEPLLDLPKTHLAALDQLDDDKAFERLSS